MTETTGRNVRIESKNPDGKKIISGGRIIIDGEDVSNHVMAVDIHMDGKSIPTARLQFMDLDVEIDAKEAAPEPEPFGSEPTPEAVTKEDIAALTQQLQTLFSIAIQCAACAADARQGTAPSINLANVIIGGEGLCHAHVDLVAGRLVRRNSSGLIISGNGG